MSKTEIQKNTVIRFYLFTFTVTQKIWLTYT